MECCFAWNASDPGIEVGIAWERSLGNQQNHGKTRVNINMADTVVMRQAVITPDFLRYLQCCGSASLSPTARIHNGSKFGRKSGGCLVSADWTRCTFFFQSVLWGWMSVDWGISLVRIAGDQALLLINQFRQYSQLAEEFRRFPLLCIKTSNTNTLHLYANIYYQISHFRPAVQNFMDTASWKTCVPVYFGKSISRILCYAVIWLGWPPQL